MAEKEYIERERAYEIITDLAGSATTKAAYAAIWKCAQTLKNIPAADVASKSEYDKLYSRYCTLAGLIAVDFPKITNRIKDLAEMDMRLMVVSGKSIEELVRLFAAGYTLQKPVLPSYDELRKYAEENERNINYEKE